MVIVFVQVNTKLIQGNYSDLGGLTLHKGELSDVSRTPLQNNLRVILHQDSTKLQFIQSTLGSELNIFIICKKTADNSLQFTIVQNPIFKSSSAYDHIVQGMQQISIEKESEILNDPLYFLGIIEERFLDLPPDDYLSYMPLMFNYLFEKIFRENMQSDSEIIKNSLKKQPRNMYSLISEMLLEENSKDVATILSKTAELQNLVNQVSERETGALEIEISEVSRLYYNLLIIAMKLNRQLLFRTILQNIFENRTDDVKDILSGYTSLLAANWYLVDDVRKSYDYIQRVREDIIRYLSIKSQINYFRLKGAIFEKIGNYSSSMDEYLSSVSLLDSLENLTSSACLAYAGIGNIYSITGQHTKAITAYSFAASLFDYLSLESHKLSMLNNILTIRMIKAKNYLSAGLVSLNNERYNEAEEYIENAVQEFSLLLIETPKKQIFEKIKEISNLLNPLVIRKGVEKNLEKMLDQTLSDVDSILTICQGLGESGTKDEKVLKQLRELSIPRKLIVHQVILIHMDGRYITSLSSEDELVEKGKDIIFAGAMTAIQLLLKEVIHSEKIHTIDAGENQILLRKSDLIQIVIIANKISEDIITAADDLINSIEQEYGNILDDWSGSLEKLNNTTSLMKEFIYDRLNE